MPLSPLLNQAATRWFEFAAAVITEHILKPLARIVSDTPFGRIGQSILNIKIETLQNKPSSRGISDNPSARITTYKPTIR